MGLRAGDTLVWIPVGSIAIVKKKARMNVEENG